MNILSPSTIREFAKYSMDVSKLTASGAFITPFFSTKEIDESITIGLATAAFAFLLAGLLLHRLADHMEGLD